MNILEFSDIKEIDKEYNYKFLVYPNITFQRALEKDSYVVVMSNVIRAINEFRNDIHFTILSPYETPSLKFDNTDFIQLDLPSYPNAMRTHFDFKRMMEIIDWKNNDFDVLYSHLPEHTLQLANLFENNTNMSPKILGYCHWYEVPENTNYNKTMLMANLAGTLEMEECGVNSEWLKSLITEKASSLLNSDLVSRLNNIIQPHYLGIDSIDISRKDYLPKSILFNHRDNEYTGWNWFVKAMDDLWQRRQDFKVYTTLASIDRPWNERVEIDSREKYLEFVQSMYIGVGCFEKYSAWSISTTDGLSRGVPYVLPNGLCYPEMLGHDYPLLYSGRAEFIEFISELLDNTEKRDLAREYIDNRIETFLWNPRVSNWFDGWDRIEENNFKIMSETDSYGKIIDIIKRKGSLSKKELLSEMGWGVRIKWSAYRNLLRTNDRIRFTKNRYEYVR